MGSGDAGRFALPAAGSGSSTRVGGEWTERGFSLERRALGKFGSMGSAGIATTWSERGGLSGKQSGTGTRTFGRECTRDTAVTPACGLTEYSIRCRTVSCDYGD